MFSKLTTMILFVIVYSSFAQGDWVQTNGPYGGKTHDIISDQNGILYAATQAGLYRSYDEGRNWLKITYYPVRDLTILPSGKLATSFILSDSKNILYSKSSNEILISKDSAKSWMQFAVLNKFIKSFFLINDNYFFAAADNGVYRSIDSGKTWTYEDFSGLTSFGSLMESKFAKDSKDNIYLVGFWDVFKSSDSGKSWKKLIMPPAYGYNFYSIYINKNDEIFIGANGNIYYSNDNGENFTSLFQINEMVYGFCEDNKNNFYCATLSRGVYLFDRINNKMILRNNGINAGDIIFLSKINNTLICRDWDVGQFKSTDNGLTWTNITMNGVLKASDDQGRIYSSDNGKIYCSTDMGDYWQTINLPNSNDYVQEIVSNNDMIFIALGYKVIKNQNVYEILKSEDFGETWKKSFSINGYQNLISLKIVGEKTIYAAYDRNLYLSNDFGETWQLDNSFNGYIQSISKSPWGNIYAGTTDGLYQKSVEGWNYIDVPWRSPNVNQVLFSSKGEMFVLGFDLYVSRDRGKSFQQLTGPSDIPNTVIRSFVLDEKNETIYLATQEQGIYKSNYSFNTVEIPESSMLYNNYPNPFNNETKIEFYIEKAGEVNFEIYSITGELVYKRKNNFTFPGYYQYNWQPSNLSSGVYLYRLKTPNFSDTKKMILLK